MSELPQKSAPPAILKDQSGPQRLDLHGRMSRPPNHVPWATVVDVDELTVHRDSMPPFPPPDDPRFLEPPVIEWVPDPAYVARGAGAPHNHPVPPSDLGYTPKSPPGRPPDTVHSYAFDSPAIRSPRHSPQEDPREGRLVVDEKVPPRSSFAEVATSDNSGKPSASSPTGRAVNLSTEFCMCNDLEEGEIPGHLVSLDIIKYFVLEKIPSRR